MFRRNESGLTYNSYYVKRFGNKSSHFAQARAREGTERNKVSTTSPRLRRQTALRVSFNFLGLIFHHFFSIMKQIKKIQGIFSHKQCKIMTFNNLILYEYIYT